MDRCDFDPDDTSTGPYLDVPLPDTTPAAPTRWHSGAPVYDADGARICGALTCGDAHFARGRCRRHYHRLRARGLL